MNIKFPLLIATVTTLAACANTPNNVTMTLTQGQCVQSVMYINQGYTPSTSIANNPVSAPYCMAVTVQNNNSGLNANNVQIINSGMSLSYTVGATAYSSMIYDPASAGISITSTVQTLGNIITYDPNNCTTTQGANVITLNQGGGTCTFYLQLSGESFPVGAYATNLTYNYTNGNQNYSTGVNFNQRVNLYAGGTNGAFIDTNGAWQNFTTPVTSGVNAIATDTFGNVYISTVSPIGVSRYNGNSAFTPVGTFSSNFLITSIATDSSGSIYAGTNGGGMYKYNVTGSNPQWVSFNSPNSSESGIFANSNIIGISNYQNQSVSGNDVLFATTSNIAYECNNPESLTTNCNWIPLLSSGAPESFNQSAIATDGFGVLYTGSGSSVSVYGLTSWDMPYIFNPIINGLVSAMVWSNFESEQNLYVGQVPITGLESAVYDCLLTGATTPPTCIPLVSESGNTLSGSISGINVDGANNVYVVGGGILSLDFSESTTVLAAYLGESTIGAVSNWTPIQNGVVTANTLNVIKSSSILTSY